MRFSYYLFAIVLFTITSCDKDRNIDNFIASWTTEYFIYEDVDSGVEAGYAKTSTNIIDGTEDNTIEIENWESLNLTVIGSISGNKVKINKQSFTYDYTPFYIYEDYNHPIKIEYEGKGEYYFDVLEIEYTIKHYNAQTGAKLYEAEAKHRSIMPKY